MLYLLWFEMYCIMNMCHVRNKYHSIIIITFCQLFLINKCHCQCCNSPISIRVSQYSTIASLGQCILRLGCIVT